MNREEFINELRIALSGNIVASEVNENVAYYEQYIDMQIKKGMSEGEVINSLGNPRLLAKSIINAKKGKQEEEEHINRHTTSERVGTTHIPVWLIRLIILLIIIAFIVLLFSFTVVAIKFFLPLILIIIVINLIIKFFRR